MKAYETRPTSYSVLRSRPKLRNQQTSPPECESTTEFLWISSALQIGHYRFFFFLESVENRVCPTVPVRRRDCGCVSGVATLGSYDSDGTISTELLFSLCGRCLHDGAAQVAKLHRKLFGALWHTSCILASQCIGRPSHSRIQRSVSLDVTTKTQVEELCRKVTLDFKRNHGDGSTAQLQCRSMLQAYCGEVRLVQQRLQLR